MKNLDLNAMGVSEMSEVEMKQTEGGLLFPFIFAAVAAAIMVYSWFTE